MIKICISGLSTSGKTTLGNEISKQFNLVHINHSYRHYTKSNEELLKILKESNEKFVHEFDNKIIEASNKNSNCVVTTWLGPWLIKDATLRIWLEASLEERAKRYSLKNLVPISDAETFIKEKDRLTVMEFKKIYNIDIIDHSIFDLCINTNKVNINNILEIIKLLVKKE
ncbi:MAG: cytidylate kinase family protein [Candidatus Marsarchaeota archaeon]|nr:cytidylate kinase family protein [Candidatus Marsarchaeota archaeon]MCL5094412.1 cytidylate kinase family protein [Candidatus Marsarchaeota archaeon]